MIKISVFRTAKNFWGILDDGKCKKDCVESCAEREFSIMVGVVLDHVCLSAHLQKLSLTEFLGCRAFAEDDVPFKQPFMEYDFIKPSFLNLDYSFYLLFLDLNDSF